MSAPVHVQRTEDGFYWAVRYDCCDTRPMRFHAWELAMRIATGHQCPKPYTEVRPHRKRLTRTVR